MCLMHVDNIYYVSNAESMDNAHMIILLNQI